jgi:phospholipid transport system substrate-binding protein
MNSRTDFVLYAVLGFGLALGELAQAGEATDQIRPMVVRVKAIVADAGLSLEQRHRKIREISDGVCDWQYMAQQVLGQYWDDRTQVERQEFQVVFADLLARAYFSKIDRLEATAQINFGDETFYPAQRAAIVRTTIVSKGRLFPINYYLSRRTGPWLVTDIKADGVRLVSNYRSQFGKIIAKESYEDLLKKLRSRQIP